MKLVFLTSGTKSEPWLESAVELYLKKLTPFFQTTHENIKSRALPREKKQAKIRLDNDQLLERIGPRDFVIALDEMGEVQKGSREFSKRFEQILGEGHNRVVIVIGGAFGISDAVRNRANWMVSFSRLTFSHQVALVVALEQIYRTLTILKNLPYHNAD
jgi:23S rRNA (pseudouridine1915-N3)-methyltransferase